MAARIVNRVILSSIPDFDVENSSAPELIEQRLKKFSDKIIIVSTFLPTQYSRVIKTYRYIEGSAIKRVNPVFVLKCEII